VLLAGLALLIFSAQPGLAQAPAFLVKDVNPLLLWPTPYDPGQILPLDETTALFPCTAENTGRELCRTDGTSEGTMILKDICPDYMDSSPARLTLVGDTAYFVADDGTSGDQLWKSDGTEAGTLLVKDIYSGCRELEPLLFRRHGADPLLRSGRWGERQ